MKDVETATPRLPAIDSTRSMKRWQVSAPAAPAAAAPIAAVRSAAVMHKPAVPTRPARTQQRPHHVAPLRAADAVGLAPAQPARSRGNLDEVHSPKSNRYTRPAAVPTPPQTRQPVPPSPAPPVEASPSFNRLTSRANAMRSPVTPCAANQGSFKRHVAIEPQPLQFEEQSTIVVIANPVSIEVTKIASELDAAMQQIKLTMVGATIMHHAQVGRLFEDSKAIAMAPKELPQQKEQLGLGALLNLLHRKGKTYPALEAVQAASTEAPQSMKAKAPVYGAGAEAKMAADMHKLNTSYRQMALTLATDTMRMHSELFSKAKEALEVKPLPSMMELCATLSSATVLPPNSNYGVRAAAQLFKVGKEYKRSVLALVRQTEDAKQALLDVSKALPVPAPEHHAALKILFEARGAYSSALQALSAASARATAKAPQDLKNKVLERGAADTKSAADLLKLRSSYRQMALTLATDTMRMHSDLFAMSKAALLSPQKDSMQQLCATFSTSTALPPNSNYGVCAAKQLYKVAREYKRNVLTLVRETEDLKLALLNDSKAQVAQKQEQQEGLRMLFQATPDGQEDLEHFFSMVNVTEAVAGPRLEDDAALNQEETSEVLGLDWLFASYSKRPFKSHAMEVLRLATQCQRDEMLSDEASSMDSCEDCPGLQALYQAEWPQDHPSLSALFLAAGQAN
mmetsp:Transcript_112290/g.195011  ORF Transcript_112290/g.195011 Transcript_112290/m.195011 type:complete len:684 (-) Transcript_112290:551-2602(-)